MMPKNGYNQDRLKMSLDRALSVLGNPSKEALMFYITEHYGISFDGSRPSITEIESALKSILGSGSTLITNIMYKELQSMVE
jgi:hypothetical protein